MKKFYKFSLVLILFVLFSNVVFAGNSVSKNNVTMKLVEDNVCDIDFGQYGTFEKRMTTIDLKNKTIDISLTATNNAKKPTITQTPETKIEKGLKDADIVFLIDNSNSMTVHKVGDLTRKETVLNSTNSLIDKLFEQGTNIKIGVVKYATNKSANIGSEDDAKIVTPSFVSTLTDAKKAIKEVQDDNDVANYPTTDIEAGLIAANKLLSTDTSTNVNKYIILLTDGIPNYAIGVGPVTMKEHDPTTSSGGFYSCYDEKVFTPTKNKLIELKNAGVNVMSVLISLSDEDKIQFSTMNPQPTYREAAEMIFGTQTNPNAGPIYYVGDSGIENAITNSIFSSLSTEKEITTMKTETHGEKYELTNIVIKDFFPDYIINNFDFAYLTKPNVGEVSANVDKSDNSITWTISKLDYGQTATFSYRLTLKDNIDSDIIAKNLKTNKNVTINYKENDTDGDPQQNDKCPIVILDVLPTKSIPQTGTNNFLIITLIASGIVIAIISMINLKRINY